MTSKVSPIGSLSFEQPGPLRKIESRPADVARAAQESQAGPPAQEAGEAAKTALPVNMFPAISLMFKVDEETNDVTVLILDKTNRKVIRTIPPEELKTMGEGKLVELFS
jgi:hypothetical protein